MYCGEVDDNGGTPFSEERTRLLNAIATHGRLAVQLVTDLGFAAVGMLERLGYWLHGFDAIRQEVNRLMKEFAPLLDEDPILQDELGHLHDAINRCSSTEVTLYLWPMRSKCYSYRRLNPGITAAVDDSCLQLNATLLHRSLPWARAFASFHTLAFNGLPSVCASVVTPSDGPMLGMLKCIGHGLCKRHVARRIESKCRSPNPPGEASVL